MKRDVKGIDPIRSIERAIKVINCFSYERQALSIDEIIEMTRLPKTTVYRILWTLEKNDLIQYDKREKVYLLGHRFLDYGGIVLDRIDIRKESEQILSTLSRTTGYTVLLAIRQHDHLQYLVSYEGNEEFRSNSTVGKRRVIHYGALGNVLMTDMSVNEIKEVLKKYPLEKRTPYTLVDEKQFFRRLQKIREQGYFVDVDETFVGFTAIAVPVFGVNKNVVAAIAMAGQTFKLEREQDQLKNLLKEAAYKISQGLGMNNHYA